MVVVADVLKRQRGPPPARVRMRGRVEAMEGGSNGSGIETAEKSTSGSRLDTREMEEVSLWFRVSLWFHIVVSFWW
jgi:hypothetical protein